MPTSLIILNAALVTFVVGVVVGMIVYAIKTSPSEAQMLRVARERHARQRRAPAAARVRATSRPAFDR